MNKTLTLVWYFYRPVMVVDLIFTAICLVSLLKIGLWFLINTLIIKALGYAAMLFYKNYFGSKTYMFYRNAGYSISRMYVYACSCDLAIYFVIIAILFSFIPQHAHLKG